MDQIRSFLRKDIVYIPAAGKIALASLGRRAQAEKGDYVSSISVKHLLISRVRGRADLTFIYSGGDVLDM